MPASIIYLTAIVNPLNATLKMVKHTQAIRLQNADDLFECVQPFCGVGV